MRDITVLKQTEQTQTGESNGFSRSCKTYNGRVGADKVERMYGSNDVPFSSTGDIKISEIMAPFWQSQGVRVPKANTYYEVRRLFRLGRVTTPSKLESDAEKIKDSALVASNDLDEFLPKKETPEIKPVINPEDFPFFKTNDELNTERLLWLCESFKTFCDAWSIKLADLPSEATE